MTNLKTRFIDELNINGVQGHTNKFDDDSYIGVLLRIKADNTAGDDVDEDDAPRIRINFRGDDIVNALWTNLRIFCDLKYGRPENAAAGATWQGGIFIPFYHNMLYNAIHKRYGDNLDLYAEAFGAACAVSCVLQVYGVYDDVPEYYVPKLIDYLETAAAGQIKIHIEQDNIAQVLVYQPATTVQTLLQMFVDNELKHSMDWGNATNLSNILARIEAAALGVVVFDMVTKGQITESLSDESVLLSTGGTGDFYYMVQSLIFNPNITVASEDVVREHFNYKLVQKTNTGKISGSIVADIHDASGVVSPSTNRTIQARPEMKEVRKEKQYPMRRTAPTSTVR
jgi:hypothetical protein